MPKSASKQPAVEAYQAGAVFNDRFRQAVEILSKANDENRELSVLECSDLQSLMGWSVSDSAKELRRLAKRRHWLSVAGTPQDRESALRAIADAVRIYETRSPSIQNEIDRLARELARLESDVSRSEKRHAEMVAAVEASKQALPREMVTLLSRQRAEIKNRLYPAVSAIETELQHCRTFAEFNLRDAKAIALLGTKFVSTDPDTKRNKLTPAFFAYQLECRSKITELENQLSEANAKLNEALLQHDARIDNLSW